MRPTKRHPTRGLFGSRACPFPQEHSNHMRRSIFPNMAIGSLMVAVFCACGGPRVDVSHTLPKVPLDTKAVRSIQIMHGPFQPLSAHIATSSAAYKTSSIMVSSPNGLEVYPDGAIIVRTPIGTDVLYRGVTRHFGTSTKIRKSSGTIFVPPGRVPPASIAGRRPDFVTRGDAR
jgi:hypothetical protein